MAMSSESIRFNDGAGYERFMGLWSRLAGIDPSEAQLADARQQPMPQSVDFVNADAMALPFPSLHDRTSWGSVPRERSRPLGRQFRQLLQSQLSQRLDHLGTQGELSHSSGNSGGQGHLQP